MKISYWKSTSVSIQSTFNLKILGLIPNINYRRVPLYPFFGFLLPDIFSEHHKTLGYQILSHAIYKINRTQERKIIQAEFVSSFEIFKCIFTKKPYQNLFVSLKIPLSKNHETYYRENKYPDIHSAL